MDGTVHQINRYPVDKDWGNQLRCPIQWIEIYLVDSAIHLLNDWHLKFEVITVQPADHTSNQWAPILVPGFLQSFSLNFFYRKCWMIVPTSSHQCHSQGRGHQRDNSHLIPNPPLFIKKKVERYPSLSTSCTCTVSITWVFIIIMSLLARGPIRPSVSLTSDFLNFIKLHHLHWFLYQVTFQTSSNIIIFQLPSTCSAWLSVPAIQDSS